MFWSLDEGCSISYGTRSVQKNVFTFGPDSQCALWLVPSSHSPLCSFFHLENDISKESRINSTYFLAQPLKACKQMLTTGAYSSLQNYGFILTFPSKSENINSCYISGFKSLFSIDLSLSARRAVTQVDISFSVFLLSSTLRFYLRHCVLQTYVAFWQAEVASEPYFHVSLRILVYLHQEIDASDNIFP